MDTFKSIIDRFALRPHPEGGHYAETYRAPTDGGQRSPVSVIHFALGANEASHWHRVDADEIWTYHAGDPAQLQLSHDGRTIESHHLGIEEDAMPHVIVPKGTWQAARSTGRWTLFSCIVAPAFEFAGFEMAPPNWYPGQGEFSR